MTSIGWWFLLGGLEKTTLVADNPELSKNRCGNHLRRRRLKAACRAAQPLGQAAGVDAAAGVAPQPHGQDSGGVDAAMQQQERVVNHMKLELEQHILNHMEMCRDRR